jgi:hypothetical protein
MASPETIAPAGTGNTGPLSGSYWFQLREGDRVELSTDGGTTYNTLDNNFRHVVISDQTVTWRNPTARTVVLNYMPIA